MTSFDHRLRVGLIKGKLYAIDMSEKTLYEEYLNISPSTWNRIKAGDYSPHAQDEWLTIAEQIVDNQLANLAKMKSFVAA
jgi:hypothetical protein